MSNLNLEETVASSSQTFLENVNLPEKNKRFDWMFRTII